MGILTDREMQSKPTGSDQWLVEPAPRGSGRLMGRITKGGERSFYFRYTAADGERDTLPIGPYHPKGIGGLSIAQAREKANALRAMYLAGARDLRDHLESVDSARRAAAVEAEATKERVRQAEADAAAVRDRRLSVRQLFARWSETQLQPRLRADGRRTGRKDGGKFVREQFERHVFPIIGDTAVEELRKADLLAILDARTAAGTMRTANMLLADLKQMLDFAAEREYVATNPISAVKKKQVGGPSVERERVLSEKELQQLSASISSANLGPRTEAAVWLVLATGVRAGELMGAIWEDALPSDPRLRAYAIGELKAVADRSEIKLGLVSLEQGRWHLLDSKNQREHVVHLSEFAKLQIRKLRALREVLEGDENGRLTPWLFPATRNSDPVCVKSFGKQLADRQRLDDKQLKNRSRSSKALLLPGGRWTAHDLRRTTGTLMARLGFATDVINECLNHMQSDRMARIYIRDRREADQSRAFDALGQHLDSIIKMRTTSGL